MSQSVTRYLSSRADLSSRELESGPLENIHQVIVVPILAERESIEATLICLAENPQDLLAGTLVIAVVNNRLPGHANATDIEDNLQTLDLLDRLVRQETAGPLANLRLGYIDAASPGRELDPKQGVGDARKIGLDWGLHALEEAGASNGILINLDADTHVEPNYLQAIRDHFDAGVGWGAVIDFAHRLDDSPEIQRAIVAYELFLRYHVLSLKHAGSPYAYHAIGSTISCTAHAYATAGGMKRRQAGEDFYFLQELAKTGHVDRIRGTTVHPSPRPSDRAPFGTGQRVQRFLDGTQQEHSVYHPESYAILGAWLQAVSASPQTSADTLMDMARSIAPALAAFLDTQDFRSTWPKLQENAPDIESLTRQFHRWFDAFTTLKLIHHLRDNGLPDRDTFEAIETLLSHYDEDTLDPDTVRADLDLQKHILQRLANLE